MSALNISNINKMLKPNMVLSADYEVDDFFSPEGTIVNLGSSAITAFIAPEAQEKLDVTSADQSEYIFVTDRLSFDSLTEIPSVKFFLRIRCWQRPVLKNDLVKKTADVLKVIGF